LAQQGTAVIVVTHEIEFAREIADTVGPPKPRGPYGGNP